MKTSGKNLIVFGFVALLSLALGMIIGATVLENRSPEKLFGGKNILIGVSVKNVPLEIKEISEDIVEAFSYQMNRALLICQKYNDVDYLYTINNALIAAAVQNMRKSQENSNKLPTF